MNTIKRVIVISLIVFFSLVGSQIIYGQNHPTQYYPNGSIVIQEMYTNQPVKETTKELKVDTYETGMVRLYSESIEFDLADLDRRRLIYFLELSTEKFSIDTEISVSRYIGRLSGKVTGVMTVEFKSTNGNGIIILHIWDQRSDGQVFYDVAILSKENTLNLIELLKKSQSIMEEHNKLMETVN